MTGKWCMATHHGGEQGDIKMIVVHSMAEYIDFNDGRRTAFNALEHMGLSAHVLVHPNGDYTRCLPDNIVGWHAKGFNEGSVGIEFLTQGAYTYLTWKERIKEEWLTKEQFRAGVSIIRSWLELFPDAEVVEHSHIDPKRKVDPGAGFPWDELTLEVYK